MPSILPTALLYESGVLIDSMDDIHSNAFLTNMIREDINEFYGCFRDYGTKLKISKMVKLFNGTRVDCYDDVYFIEIDNLPIFLVFSNGKMKIVMEQAYVSGYNFRHIVIKLIKKIKNSLQN